MATAIFTRRLNPALNVVLFDGARQPGAKILVSGGSRCNVTNSAVSEDDFWGGRRSIIRKVLRALTVDETVAFFSDLGVALHEERDGKLFPDSNRSRDVLAALLGGVSACGATLLAGHRVHGVAPAARGFEIDTTQGTLIASRVVLATGGRSLPKSGSDGAGYSFAKRLGHSIVPTTPGLVPLTLDEGLRFHVELSGVSHPAELAVWIDGRIAVRLAGSLLWTHFGISGPVALDASRHWLRARETGRDTGISVNFYPGLTFDDLDRHLTSIARSHPRMGAETVLATGGGAIRALPASVARAVLPGLRIAGDQPLSQLARDDRRQLVRTLTERPLPISGSRGYNYAEVTAGGVDLAEIDPSTMESRVCPGVFLVGEVLDVDGRIGGFNFQWAWSSARAAARGLSRRLSRSADL
jgi:predicted Rossmann fold flavoprotein